MLQNLLNSLPPVSVLKPEGKGLNSDPTKRVKKSVNKKKNNGNNGGTKAKWIQKIFILAFAFSVFFSFISENLLQRVNIYVSILILLIIIKIGRAHV